MIFFRCCMRVLTGLRAGKYYQIMRWWSSSLGQWLLQSYNMSLLYRFIIVSYLPTCFNCVMDLRSPPCTSLLLIPHISPFDAASLSLCTHFSPPTLPGPEQPSTWTAPPPAGLYRSSALTSLSRWPQGVLHASMRLTPLIQLPPLWRPRHATRSL